MIGNSISNSERTLAEDILAVENELLNKQNKDVFLAVLPTPANLADIVAVESTRYIFSDGSEWYYKNGVWVKLNDSTNLAAAVANLQNEVDAVELANAAQDIEIGNLQNEIDAVELANAAQDIAIANTQNAVNNKVSLTGNETIADVKTFTDSPIVPRATQAGQAVNFEQLETKQDKFKYIYEKELHFFADTIGYQDINLGNNALSGNIEVKIVSDYYFSIQYGIYEKKFYRGLFLPSFFHTNFLEKIIFYDGFLKIATKLIIDNGNLILRVYKNDASTNPFHVELRFNSGFENLNLKNNITPTLLPFVPTPTIVFQEPKAIPVTRDPDVPIVSAQSNIGNIIFLDKTGAIFSDLATARQYVSNYGLVPFDESFSAGTYTFSVPPNSVVNDSFCSNNNSEFEFLDPLGYIVSYGQYCFNNNLQVFKIITKAADFNFGCFNNNVQPFLIKIHEKLKTQTSCFYNAIFHPDSVINFIEAVGSFSFSNCKGRLKLNTYFDPITGKNGNIGATSGQDFTDGSNFQNCDNLILNVPYESMIVNGFDSNGNGIPDRDLAQIITQNSRILTPTY